MFLSNLTRNYYVVLWGRFCKYCKSRIVLIHRINSTCVSGSKRLKYVFESFMFITVDLLIEIYATLYSSKNQTIYHITIHRCPSLINQNCLDGILRLHFRMISLLSDKFRRRFLTSIKQHYIIHILFKLHTENIKNYLHKLRDLLGKSKIDKWTWLSKKRL